MTAAIAASGVDTVSLAWRPTREAFFDGLLLNPHRPTGGGGQLFDTKGPGGTRIVAYPAYGVCAVEGRLDAWMTGSATAYDLRPKSDLPHAEVVGLAMLEHLAGTAAFRRDECGDAETRRYDLTAEAEFDEPPAGLGFLRTFAAIVPPGRKTDTWRGADGQPQTVYYRTGKRGVVTERIYDKGVESGSHPAGLRIRIEAQRRPPKSKRMRPGVIAGGDLAGDFGRSMEAYVRGNENVIAAGTDGALRHLATKAAAGEMSIAKAERMIGTVAVLREFGRGFYPDEQQSRRRLRQLRETGLALDEELPPGAVVPVGELLRDAIARFTA